MTDIRVACQTYTWEMLGDAWQGRVTDLLDWIAGAGYAGIEITLRMVGEFRDRPEAFGRELRNRDLELAAFGLSTDSGFTDPCLLPDDLAAARRAVAFLSHFAGARLQMGSPRCDCGPDQRRAALDRAIELYNEIGRMAAAEGVRSHVHPNSAATSLAKTGDEYAHLVAGLAPECVSLGLDSGHVVRGGQDLLTCARAHLSRIAHVHLKDVRADGQWTALGGGVCDVTGLLELLKSVRYRGWLVAEEESEDARRDGVAAIRANRDYLRALGH